MFNVYNDHKDGSTNWSDISSVCKKSLIVFHLPFRHDFLFYKDSYGINLYLQL